MPFLEAIEQAIGSEALARLDSAANKEVGLAMQMALTNEAQQDRYYTRRFLFDELPIDCETFESKNLRILPIDVIDILFQAKLLFAAGSEREYQQRRGGLPLLGSFAIPWSERSVGLDAITRSGEERRKKSWRLARRGSVPNRACAKGRSRKRDPSTPGGRSG